MKWKCGSCSWGFTRVGSPDCRCWCRLHSSGSPKLSLGSRLELIAGNRRSRPSAGKHTERGTGWFVTSTRELTRKRRLQVCETRRKWRCEVGENETGLKTNSTCRFLCAKKQRELFKNCNYTFSNNPELIHSVYLNGNNNKYRGFMCHSFRSDPCNER